MFRIVLGLTLLLAPAARAASGKADAGSADATAVQLADYFIKTPTGDANPKLVEPFLAVNVDALPARQREKARAKQVEIRTLVKMHDTKKKGNWLTPEDCTLDKFVHPHKDKSIYGLAGYTGVTEEELKYVTTKTKCTEKDLGCQFTLIIFYDKDKPKQPRGLMFHAKDPIMAIVAESHGAGGQSNFFGIGLTCQH